MKIQFILVAGSVAILSLLACKSGGKGSSSQTFCDTACFKDTLEFTGNHPDSPYIRIVPKDCYPDSIFLNSAGMANMTKTKFDYADKKLNKNFVRCLFKDADYAWIIFNDCATSKGYQLKIPLKPNINYERRPTGLNNFDKKFAIADNIIVAMDRGNLFIEDVSTGKKATMTFGKAIAEVVDYENIHDHIDSLNITNNRFWVKVKIDNKWEEKEKTTIKWE